MNQLDLAGRVAVVTGAAGGLGLGVVTGAVFDASGGRATY
jgi:NAD(P)-dependent dehydrogenase (short-subunit alcohol dehydrogenase family)